MDRTFKARAWDEFDLLHIFGWNSDTSSESSSFRCDVSGRAVSEGPQASHSSDEFAEAIVIVHTERHGRTRCKIQILAKDINGGPAGWNRRGDIRYAVCVEKGATEETWSEWRSGRNMFNDEVGPQDPFPFKFVVWSPFDAVQECWLEPYYPFQNFNFVMSNNEMIGGGGEHEGLSVPGTGFAEGGVECTYDQGVSVVYRIRVLFENRPYRADFSAEGDVIWCYQKFVTVNGVKYEADKESEWFGGHNTHRG